MPNTDNEEFRTIYRSPYSVDASASAKMLNKYYDARKDGEIVDVVTLTEPYNVIGHHAFDFCHIKELTLPDTVIRLCRFAFADCKTLKKVTLGKGIKKCGEDLIFRSGVQEIVWTKPIGEDVDEALLSLLYGLIREESTIFYNTNEVRLNRGRIFLQTGEAQKTFLLTYDGRNHKTSKMYQQLHQHVCHPGYGARSSCQRYKKNKPVFVIPPYPWNDAGFPEQNERCTGTVHPGGLVRCEKIPSEQCGKNCKSVCGKRRRCCIVKIRISWPDGCRSITAYTASRAGEEVADIRIVSAG